MASSSAQKQVIAEKIVKGSAQNRCFSRGGKLRRDEAERREVVKLEAEAGEEMRTEKGIIPPPD